MSTSPKAGVVYGSIGARPQRGWRECADIIKAAEGQGWRIKRAGDSHLRLIPPSGVPVGISGTPSDTNYRRQIIRLMRRSGFIWPWVPEEDKMPHIGDLLNDQSTVTEMWRPIDQCSVAEISNGARVRKSANHKIIDPDENGYVTLTDDRGNVRVKSPTALCRTHFGHGPIKNVVPETVAMSHRSSEVAALVNNQEESTMTTTLEADVSTNGHAERWEPVLIEGFEEGYEVNEKAEVMAPQSARLRNRTLLTTQIRDNGVAWVNMRAANGKYRMVKLEEVVLEAFEARPSPDHVPEHVDGDTTNCVLSNLRWALPASIPTPAAPVPPPAEGKWVDVPVEDVPVVPIPVSERSIDSLDLTVRTYNLLSREGIHTVGALMNRTPNSLLDLRNFRENSVEELERKLAELGVAMQPNPVEPQAEPVAENVEEVDPKIEARRKADRERKRKVTANKSANKSAKRVKKTPAGGIERLRITRMGGLTVTVNAEGKADLSKAKGLSPAEMVAMAELVTDVVAMNKLMGLS